MEKCWGQILFCDDWAKQISSISVTSSHELNRSFESKEPQQRCKVISSLWHRKNSFQGIFTVMPLQFCIITVLWLFLYLLKHLNGFPYGPEWFKLLGATQINTFFWVVIGCNFHGGLSGCQILILKTMQPPPPKFILARLKRKVLWVLNVSSSTWNSLTSMSHLQSPLVLPST